MMSKQMLAAAAAVLVVGVVAISIWASDPGTPSLDPSERGTGEQRGEEKAPDTMKSTAEAGMERTELVSSARKPASGVHYAGKILDTRGQPLAGVRLLPAKAPSATPYAESDRMGLFSFTHKKLEETPQVDERFTIVRGRPLNQETTQPDAMLYIVAPNVSVTGQVFNEESVALAGVTVEVQLLPLLDFPAPLDDTDGPGFSGGETNEIGRFDIAGLPGGAARLRLSKDGFENAYCEIPTSNKLGVPIVLKREKGNRSSLAGRVFDHRGMPVPKATVGLGKRTTKTDAFGAYRLTFDRNGKDYAGGKSPLYAGKPGLQTRLIRDFSLPEARHARQDLHLAGPTLSIEGVVRDAEGELAADVLVVLWKEEQIANTTFAENLALDDSIKPLPGFGYAKVYARTKSDGAFVLRGLSARTYVLRVLHKQHLSFSTEPIQAGTRGLELRYPADNFRKLTGRVVNRDGEPMPKIRVGMSVCVYKTSGGNSWKRGEETVTNAKGEFTLHKVLRHEQTLLSFMGDSIITGFEAIGKGFTDGFKPEQGRADNPDVVEIVVDRRCHFRIETDDPALARARFQLLDANGKNMQISAFSAGGGSTNNETMSLRRGKTPVLATSERTVTLLLVKEKRRIPMSLTPGKVAVVRL